MKPMGKEHPSYKNLETMSVLAAAALVFGLVLKIQALFYISLAFLVVGIFIKGLAGWIARGWLAFAHVLGSVNSKIILALIFFLFLTPLAFIYRLFHGDFMHIRRDAGKTTYYMPRDHLYSAKDVENLW
jgi:hypothetical protein